MKMIDDMVQQDESGAVNFQRQLSRSKSQLLGIICGVSDSVTAPCFYLLPNIDSAQHSNLLAQLLQRLLAPAPRGADLYMDAR